MQCKAARGLCGIDPCPLLRRVQSHLPQGVRAGQSIGRHLWGSSPPSLFVGRHGYPAVNVGPMLPPEHLEPAAAAALDAPRTWLDHTIADVVGLRSSLVRTLHKVRVQSVAPGRPERSIGGHDGLLGGRLAKPLSETADRITRLSQELAVASRPVDTEVVLAKAPAWSLGHVTDFTTPHGPSATVERATLGENAPVERRMEAAVSDTDLLAADALWSLYQSGTDAYQLERVLSAGMLGLGSARRLVPTRWSITATDDTIGRRLIDEVRDYPTIDKPVVHEGEAFGNRFLVLLVPRVWGFDNIEVWLKGSFWARAVVPAEDWEDHRGRTTYAANTTGGYYATRRSVLEHLAGFGRQATAVCLREIDDRYTTPLGVWVVREGCARALAGDPLVFEDMDAALRHMDRRARFKSWQQSAELLATVKQQRPLDHWD